MKIEGFYADYEEVLGEIDGWWGWEGCCLGAEGVYCCGLVDE